MRPNATRKTPADRLNSSKAGQVRIISGQWRRQMLPVLAHDGLRPSSDRVRETVFNWIHHLWGGQFADKHVLDVFAGSGAFGLECISRGARDVTMLDVYPAAVNAILQTLQHWQQQDESVAQAKALCVDSTQTLIEMNQRGAQYDLIFLDPPFGHDWLSRIIPLVLPLCHDDTLLYVETEKNTDLSALTESCFENLREGKTQQVRYGLWRVSEA